LLNGLTVPKMFWRSGWFSCQRIHYTYWQYKRMDSIIKTFLQT